MRFPEIIKHRRFEATIYGKSEKFPYYRLAYRSAGKRILRSFSTYSEAKTEAEKKVRELSTGDQSIALSAKEVADTLAIRDALANFRVSTGIKLTAVQAVTGYLDVMKLLPPGHNPADAIRGYVNNLVVVQRKSLAEAVAEFCNARKAKTVEVPGKRPALNPVYVADTARRLNEFATAFTGTIVADLTKDHIQAFASAYPALSGKSRNHLRATLRMFLRWCVRRDYLAANHRLLETDGLRNEAMNDAPIDFYRPTELRALLDHASDQMRPVIALQALAGVRLQEALRLDWRDVFGIAGHIEVSTATSKNRQRRLVAICPALKQWLAPYRGKEGKITAQSLNGYTASFILLRKSLKFPSRRNGLRHGFVSYHYALHQNENLTAALAGHSPTVLHRHYRGLTTQGEAAKWFNVRPAKAGAKPPQPKQTGA